MQDKIIEALYHFYKESLSDNTLNGLEAVLYTKNLVNDRSLRNRLLSIIGQITFWGSFGLFIFIMSQLSSMLVGYIVIFPLGILFTVVAVSVLWFLRLQQAIFDIRKKRISKKKKVGRIDIVKIHNNAIKQQKDRVSKYSSREYYKDLKVLLKKTPRKHQNASETGFTYFSDTLRIKVFPTANKAEFMSWLLLSMMIDNIFFTHYRNHYSALKKSLNTLRFEDGLTGEVLNPDDLIIRLLRYVPAKERSIVFSRVTLDFHKKLCVFLEGIEVPFKEVQDKIFADKDLISGIFGLMYTEASGRDDVGSFRRVPKKIHLSDIDEDVEINVLEKI